MGENQLTVYPKNQPFALKQVMPNRKQIIAITVLGIVALMLGCKPNAKVEQEVAGDPTIEPKPDPIELKPNPIKELTSEEKVVGTYEAKKEEATVKLVLLENGKSEHWVNGEKKGEATWKLVEKEVHVLGRKRLFFGDGEDARVYKIEPNGDLTWIANIRDGKREDVPIGEQFTFKKIK